MGRIEWGLEGGITGLMGLERQVDGEGDPQRACEEEGGGLREWGGLSLWKRRSPHLKGSWSLVGAS